MTEAATTDGLVVVDKEAGWTSHDVVARCRHIFGQRRVGHAGTLDPGATGLLLVGLGTVTRLLQFLSALPKSYEGEVVLGTATSTLDADGEVTGTWDMGQVSVADARAAAAGLTGDIMQIPPMVSAIKVGGRRLHQLARAGVEVDRPPRPVRVERLDLDATGDRHVLHMTVDCSTGTYVRSLAADLGARLGGGAHLRNLRRTAVGSFTVAEARQLDEIDGAAVVTPQEALRDLPATVVHPPLSEMVRHGAILDLPVLDTTGEGPWRVQDESGQLLAVYRADRGRARPAVVVPARS